MKRMIGSCLILALLVLPLGAVSAQGGEQVLPQAYADVADEMAAIEQETLMAGEEAVSLFLNQDMETLYNWMSDEARATLALEMLTQAYDQLTAVAPIGERIDYRVMPMSSDMAAVYMLYAWGQMPIQLIAVFDSSDQITALAFQPVMPLPDDPAAGYASPISFRLPFEGLWYVGWGGPDALHNYHVDAAPQRHAYDFLIWDNGSTFSGDGTSAEDYYAYGQTVFAPAAGTVVRAVDGLPDMLPQVETDAMNPAGNHVVIQVAEGEYLFIAHLQPGSLLVAEGDTVAAGQPVGLVGNSGNTSEPHIHIHLQNTDEMFTYDETGAISGLSDAIGLPLEFTGIRVNGEPVAVGVPLGGQFAQPDGD